MKVAPMPAQSAPNLTPPSGGPSPDARERAIAAFRLGTASARPSDTPSDPRMAREQANPRRIQMQTDHSPDRHYQETMGGGNPPPQTQNPTESAIPHAGGADTGVEETTNPISPQFAALARQRRALQVKERELADKERAFAANPPGDAALIQRLKAEPLSVLQEHGVTYDQLTQAIMGTTETFDREAVESSILERVEGVLSEKEKASERAVMAQMQREAEGLAREGENFEMVRETRSIPDVMRLIERTYRESGEVLDVSEAMQLVEDELLQESVRIASIKKLQSRLAPQAPVMQPQTRQMRTLTNQDMGRAPMSAKARALAAFHGTLTR